MLAVVDSDFAAMTLVCSATRTTTMMVAAAMAPMHVYTVVALAAQAAAAFDVGDAVAPAGAKVFASAYSAVAAFVFALVWSVYMLVPACPLALAGYAPDCCHSSVARASVVACQAPAVGAADATHLYR